MSTATQATECPFCRKILAPGRSACPECKATADGIETVRALEFAQHRFEQWAKEGVLYVRQARTITDFYNAQRADMVALIQRGKAPALAGLPAFDECWSCGNHSAAPPPYCAECGAPWDSPAVRSLRFMTVLCHEIKRHEEAGRLALAQAHDLLTATRERMAALNTRLEKERAPAVEAIVDAPAQAQDTATAAPQKPATAKAEQFRSAGKSQRAGRAPPDADVVRERRPRLPRRALWEILLDPRNIQWLLMFGAFLLVVGLVIWLAALGVFEHKEVLATIMGVANVAVLAGGWAILRYTRYQTAGRALTLLACLVMPLNLWFYHANNLITLSGHLWVAALICCILYAASALTLRDQMFVYVLMGGVALTGLLLLGDANIARIWEIAPPATLLVVLGLIGIHIERGFPEGDGPFSRKNFGLAFFWSGHALLGAGLLLVLGAQVAGWLYEPIFRGWGLANAPEIVAPHSPLKLLALALVLAGAYAYLYSDIVVRRIGIYIYVAIFVLLWAEVLVIELIGFGVASEVVIIVLALTALAANLIQFMLTRANATFTRAGPPLGLFLSTIPVLLGIVLYMRATALHDVWALNRNLGIGFVAAMAVTAASSRIGAYLYRHSMPWLSAVYFFGTAAATLVGAAGLLMWAGVKSWDVEAPILMLIPIAYVIASRLYRGHTAEEPLVWVGHAATAVMIVAVTAAASKPLVYELLSGDPTNLLLALFFAEAALFYGLVAGLRKEGYNLYLAASMACGAIWQFLLFWSLPHEVYTLVFASLGFLLLIAYRVGLLESFQATRLARAAFQSANALMSISFVAAALITLSKFASQTQDALHWHLVGLLITLTVISLLAAWSVREHNWRRWYVVTAIGEGLLAAITLNLLSELTPHQRLEIFSIVVGLLLLLISHAGWYREQDRHSDMVSLGLLLGGVLAGLPLTIAVLSYRSPAHPMFHWQDELGMLIVGVLLLATGFMFQLRATTLIGGSMLAVYLVTLLMFIARIEAMKSAGVLLTIGGASVFAIGLLLSIYRDRLLMLPDKIKRRAGVFRVLGWR